MVDGLVAAPVQILAAEASDTDARLYLLFGAHSSCRDFLRELQMTVARNAREAVSRLVSYPVLPEMMRLKTPARLLAHYDASWPRKSRDAIACQDPASAV